jgi:radical SAM superfamily enzyme YgiQ (UPF0313 family)
MLAETSLRDAIEQASDNPLSRIAGLAWRDNDEIVINPDRPFIPRLDDLPMPLHELLPLEKQGVRLRSPENILAELQRLAELGIHNVHMYADLFTVNREQVVGLCGLIISSGLKVRWTCNSRVDYVDEEMLRLMGQAGCWLISWGIESANEAILKHARKGYRLEQAVRALRWAKSAGIRNWGYFIIGLATFGYCLVPHCSSLSGYPLLLRGGGKRLVPPGHQVGGSRHGSVHGLGLPRLAGRAVGILAEASHQGMVAAPRPDLDLPQGSK